MLLVMLHCVSFADQPMEVTADHPDYIDKDYADSSIDLTGADLHLSGFGFFEQDRAELSSHIRKNFIQSDSNDSDLLLYVYLEEDRKNPGWIRFGNVIVSIFSLTLIPYYEHTTYRLGVRVSRRGVVITDCIVRTGQNEFVSVLLIPFAFFAWPDVQRRASFQSAFDYITTNCLNRR
ncbi:MAG: hypothetical protein KDK27_19530 [Leptospiraceae bacterium]|nr:hypothetical protein [Leptospiraceae bacterium]